MKKAISFLSIVLSLVFYSLPSFAQDDVYYDPNKDKGYQESHQTYENNTQQNNSNQNYSNQNNAAQQNQTTDRTDGYNNNNDNPAYKYDPRDNNSSNANSYDGNYYATDASYYDDDYDTYFYTTRLHRYYRPNYGVNYYSYYFTPSYYNGWNNWNTSAVVSVSPWYSNPWWRWNRHAYRPVVVYDPYYSPYWDWSWGCNSYSYYNSWGYPSYGYSSCGYYNGYSTWGYNGWGYNNGGFCGGYYNGYSNGYYNGYNNGYYNGYSDGWNTAYGGYGHNYYYGHRHKDADMPGSGEAGINYGKNGSGGGLPPVKGGGREITGVTGSTATGVTTGDMHNVNIPREGIQRPITNAEPVKAKEGLSITSPSPYNEKNPNVVVRPAEPNNVNTPPNRWEDKNVNAAPNTNQQPNMHEANTNNNNFHERTQPQNNGWNEAPKQNNQPVQQNNGWHEQEPQNYGHQPVEKPRENNWNQQPRPNEQPVQREWNQQPRQVEQPRNFEQQRPVEQPRHFEQQRPVEQPRNFEQPRQMEQRNFNAQPRMEQQRNNFQPAPQRSAPQGGGGGFKRH